MRLNESAEKTSALLLANVVCRLAIEEKTKTLLITGQPSLTVLALNLLLYRAKIDLDKITSSKWYKSELDRLGVATRELVCAPLWVRGQMPTPNYITGVDSVMDTDNSRCLVLDNPPPDSIWQWQQLSREFGIPITIVSADSVL